MRLFSMMGTNASKYRSCIFYKKWILNYDWEKFFLNVYWRNFGQFGPVRPSGYCESYISATVRVIILKQKPKDAQFSILWSIKFSKQSTKSSDYEIYSNGKFPTISQTDFWWALYLQNYQSRKFETKTEITAIFFSSPYHIFVVADQCQRARFLSELT